jgi:hypothetical protein
VGQGRHPRELHLTRLHADRAVSQLTEPGSYYQEREAELG